MTEQPPPDPDLAEQRAEEIVDRLGQVSSELASQALRWLAVTGARAREEVEDIWAEAQDLSRSQES